MVAAEKFTTKEHSSQRDETLSLSQLDTDYLERRIQDDLQDFKNTHEHFFEQRREWLLAMRDLRFQYKKGYFEEASDLHIPYSLIMHKAMHARVFEVFSKKSFFAVEANNEVFKDSEETIKFFMDWVLSKWLNRGRGKQDAIDHWISDILEEGTGVLKLWWDSWEDTFVDLDLETEELDDLNLFGIDDLEIEDTEKVSAKFKNIKKTLKQSAPAAATVSVDDFFMPPGQLNVQQSPWVAHRVRLLDEDLKMRAKQGKFDTDVVDEALERRLTNSFDGLDETDSSSNRFTQNLKRDMRDLEGVSNNAEETRRNKSATHSIIEWYGKAYVKKNVDDDDFENRKEFPEEIVIWYHEGIRKILGWTYLYRVSPSGKRPFYKADFMPSKERAIGIGIGELLFSLNNHIDAVHNIKMDNGVLASMQFGVYRAGSSFKPDTFKMKPGDLIPVEDINDIKFQSVPYLGQFGEQEELMLTGYGEKLLAINDINLGNLTGRGVAGALRNATGANFIDRQANIQLQPHLDRISRELKDFLSDLFIMTRSRMKQELFFRVTGEDGKGIFGDIKAEDLRGDYDFVIDVDIAATSEAERQQRAALMLQTILNPTFIQSGIVQPGNLYEVLKEFLIRHQIREPDKFITRPPQYRGPPLTPEQRIMKILLNRFDNPPVEQTVRTEDDHTSAMETYDEFEKSDLFGTLDQDQLAAYSQLKEETLKMQTLVEGQLKGVPNQTGTQLPGEGGLPPIGPSVGGPEGIPDADQPEGGPLGSPLGEPNGPIL